MNPRDSQINLKLVFFSKKPNVQTLTYWVNVTYWWIIRWELDKKGLNLSLTEDLRDIYLKNNKRLHQAQCQLVEQSQMSVYEAAAFKLWFASRARGIFPPPGPKIAVCRPCIVVIWPLGGDKLQ